MRESHRWMGTGWFRMNWEAAALKRAPELQEGQLGSEKER